MPRSRVLMALLLAVCLVVSLMSGSPVSADPVVPPDPSNAASGVPVGRTTITVTDTSRDRTFDVDIWYPATQAGDDSYIDLVFTQLQTTAYADVPVASGTFPLVLFSHAHTSDRFQSYHQMEVIASHGFIVAAPSHPGDTFADAVHGTTDSFQQSVSDRYYDMLFTKDSVLASPTFGSHILMDAPGDPRLAVMGHSMGAATALALSDGQNDAWQNVPADPDVDAVVAIAPALMFYTPDTGGATEDPLLIIGGSADTVTPPSYSQTLWDNWNSVIKFRDEVTGMTHAEPSSGCFIRDAIAVALVNDPNNPTIQAAMAQINGTMNGGCDQPPPTVLHWFDVQKTVQAFEVPFLIRRLKFDSNYETWLSRARSNRAGLLPNDYWRCTAPAGPCDTVPS